MGAGGRVFSIFYEKAGRGNVKTDGLVGLFCGDGAGENAGRGAREGLGGEGRGVGLWSGSCGLDEVELLLELADFGAEMKGFGAEFADDGLQSGDVFGKGGEVLDHFVGDGLLTHGFGAQGFHGLPQLPAAPHEESQDGQRDKEGTCTPCGGGDPRGERGGVGLGEVFLLSCRFGGMWHRGGYSGSGWVRALWAWCGGEVAFRQDDAACGFVDLGFVNFEFVDVHVGGGVIGEREVLAEKFKFPKERKTTSGW